MDIKSLLETQFKTAVYLNDPLNDIVAKLQTIYSYKVETSSSLEQLSTLRHNLTLIKNELQAYKSAHRIYWFFINLFFGFYENLLNEYVSFCLKIADRQNTLLKSAPPTVIDNVIIAEHQDTHSLKVLLGTQTVNHKFQIEQLESQLDFQIQELRGQLKQKTLELEALRTTLKSENKDAKKVQKLEESLSRKKEDIEYFRKRLKELGDLIKKKDGHIEDLNSELTQSDKEQKRLQRKIEKLTAENSGLTAKAQEWEEAYWELDRAKTTEPKPTKELSELRSLNLHLQSMITPLEDFINQIQTLVHTHGHLTLDDFNEVVAEFADDSQKGVLSEE